MNIKKFRLASASPLGLLPLCGMMVTLLHKELWRTVMEQQGRQRWLRLNQQAWDQRTDIHIDSGFYDVAGFVAGQCRLNPIELELMGAVRGKRLLHLQCHFGLDTLSWSRRGAWVTGVDLSPQAIAKARQLARDTRQAAHFVCADVIDFGDEVEPEYDWVFVSYGALCWLDDINRWAQTVKRALKPNGKLCLVEFHPAIDMLMDYGYFHRPNPDVAVEATYTENAGTFKQRVAVWNHSLGEVIGALLQQGLVVEHFAEHRHCPYRCFDQLTATDDGQYQWLQGEHPLPLLYSLVARNSTGR
nr:class I SAM-dependent methyltransferase [Ferrimonas senticii]